MLLLAILAAVPTDPAMGSIKTFADWAVACDNVRACEMTALAPDGGDWPDDGPRLASIERKAGPDGTFRVSIDAGDAKGDAVVAIDGQRVGAGRIAEGQVTLTGADAARLVTAAANGTALTLADARGKMIARVSLKGSSAALRFIDAEQGRAGGVTAAIARGPKPASAVPAPPAVPRIVRVKADGTAVPITAAMRAQMEKMVDCSSNYSDDNPAPEVETAALGGGATLALLPCGNGAYNFSSVAFIIRGSKVETADFDYLGDAELLTNAGWDPKKSELSTYSKGRGVGDCGESARYIWDGTSFRAIEVREMDECRGSINWLRIWHAEAVTR